MDTGHLRAAHQHLVAVRTQAEELQLQLDEAVATPASAHRDALTALLPLTRELRHHAAQVAVSLQAGGGQLMATEVCVDCGRSTDQQPSEQCTLQEWHDPFVADALPPVQAQGLELVLAQGSELQRVKAELAAVHQVLCAIVSAREDARLEVPLEHLNNPGHGVLHSWRDEARRVLILQAGP